METGTFQGLLMLKIEQVFWAGKLFEQPLPESELHQGKETPPFFYHGTDVYNMLQILICGLMSSDNIRGRPHSPDGIYSYSLHEESLKSMYFKGAVVTFTNHHSICVSEAQTKKLAKLPQGIIGRRKRSLVQRVGNEGSEYIHCPSDCCVTAVFCDMVLLSEALQSLIKLPMKARVSFPEEVTRAMAWGQKQAWKSGKEDKAKAEWKADYTPDWKGASAADQPWQPGAPAGSGAPFPPPPGVPPPAPAVGVQDLKVLWEAAYQAGRQSCLDPAAGPAAGPAAAQLQQGVPNKGHPAISWAQHQHVEEWAVKGVLTETLKIRATKLRWCWKCYSMSFFGAGTCCTRLGCAGFGFAEEMATAETSPVFGIIIGL